MMGAHTKTPSEDAAVNRILVAFEAPTEIVETTYAEAWNEFVSALAEHKLQLVDDLTPVNVLTVPLGSDSRTTIEIFEAVTA